MLTIRDLKMSFGGRVLFEGAGVQINHGEHVALVGPNGAGKSTLFSLILGEKEPDEGEIERDEWSMVGYLAQESEPAGEETVIEIATGRAGQLQALEKQMAEFEERGEVSDPAYYEAQAKHGALIDPGLEAKAKKMLAGLGYRQADFDRKVREMSGGWIMRAHLARLLAMEPDLLMLDEPTNHLDLMSLLWLQAYLKDFGGALLMISHDREFMDSLTQKVYEISGKKLISYTGNYTDYEQQKEANFVQQSAAYKNQQKEIKALKDFADRFRSVSSKASQAQSKLKQIDRMELVEKPEMPRKPFRFQFPQPQRVGQRALMLEGIHMAYGDVKVYENMDFIVERGDRTALVGPNGSGKSTLLKILAGVLEFQRGDRREGHAANIGYFSQHRSATLDPNNTVLDEVMQASDMLKEEEARAILGCFMFRKEEIYKKTDILSGGEKTRLNLVKFLVNPPNVLLMDEPTTHLDILTVESLILALEKFEGSLIFISHDVHFIRKLATKIVQVVDGNLRSFHGGYDYFLEKTGAVNDPRAALTAK
jgi:ATP-binding cassette subfamily F protein 3